MEQQWRTVTASMTRVPGFTVAAARPWRTAHHLPAAVRAARACAPQVVYANRAEQLLWATIAARRARAALVVHLRHHPFPAPLVRLLGRGDTRYLAVSRFMQDRWIAAGLNPRAVEVVPNGVDTNIYRPPAADERTIARARLGIPDDRPLVLCYGRLSIDKGIATLLAAWSAQRRSGSPAQLILAGDADPEVRDLVGGQDGSVRWEPRRDDVTGLLHAADLVVLPATWEEPFGRVVIEAMSAGVPVVASRIGGIPEILTGRFASHLVPAGNATALASAMTGLLGWRQGAPDLGSAGRQHVRRHFHLDHTVDRVESALVRAVDQRRQGVQAWSPKAV